VKNPVAIAYGDNPITATEVKPGDRITVNGIDLRVAGVVDEAIMLDNDGFVNGVQVIVYDTVYDQITGQKSYSELYPMLSPDADRAAVEQAISNLCEQTGGSRYVSYENTDQQLRESYEQIKMLAWGLILFVGLIGLLNIVNTVYTNIHTRVREIGVQRAIGMSAGGLYKTFLWEGAYYGVIADVIGGVAGYICTMFVGAAATDALQLVAVPVLSILEAAVLSVAACLIATCIPLKQIARMSVVKAIGTAL
jgi:ABC-type antimicrobial peptide transport system permease subunit